MSIVLIGDVFLDILTHVNFDELKCSLEAETDTLSPSLSMVPGGSGLNTSFRVKELSPDIDIHFLSAIGSDQHGAVLENSLQEVGIRSSLVKDLPGQTGACIVLSSDDAKRAFITQRGVIDTFKVGDFPDEVLNDVINRGNSHLHCAGFFNCGGLRLEIEEEKNIEGRIGNLIDLFIEAQRKDMTTSINPQDDANGNFIIPRSLLKVTTFLIGNGEEITKISNALRGGVSDPSSTWEDIAEAILAVGTKYVIITRGKEGVECFWYKNSERREVEAIIQPGVDLGQLGIEVTDTTGAGDAFIGGFLTEVAKSKSSGTQFSITRACRVGTLMGAHAATVNGGSTIDRAKLTYLREASKI